MNNSYQTLILGGGLSGLDRCPYLTPKRSRVTVSASWKKAAIPAASSAPIAIRAISPRSAPMDSWTTARKANRLLAETGLDRECVKAPLIDFVRYVYLHGRLNLIPQTPGKILRAPLIPWQAKLRVLAELWQPILAGEPTVAKWINHRFGPALLPFIDAVYTGTYAGDCNRLTIDSVMPGVRALEKEYGSVLRGLITTKLRKKRRGNGEQKASFIMPAMTSFPTGMQRLPERLTEPLTAGSDLQLNTEIKAVQTDGTGWQVHTSRGLFLAQNIVFALPINVALKLLGPLDANLPEKSVPETWIATVVFGFDDSVSLPPGFGYLTPEQEQRFTLGSLFSSNMFPGRAPKGHIVFETLVGGRRHPERLELGRQDPYPQGFC